MQRQLKLNFLHPSRKLEEQKHRLVLTEEKVCRLMKGRLEYAKQAFQIRLVKLKGLSPLEKLDQGYSVMEDEAGKMVKSVLQVQKGQSLTAYVKDGKMKVDVTQVFPGKENVDE